MASMASGGDGGATSGSSVVHVAGSERAWRCARCGWQGAATPRGDIGSELLQDKSGNTFLGSYLS
eukprot:5805120-Prymnesium_polylepis.1